MALLMCAHKNHAASPSVKEGEKPPEGGGGKVPEVNIEELTIRAERAGDLEKKTSMLRDTLKSLFPDQNFDGDNIFSAAGSIGSRCEFAEKELARITKKIEHVGKTLEELYPKRCVEGETCLSLAEKIIREHAEKVQGKPGAVNIVEGASVQIIGKDGKGTHEAFVIGVIEERGEVCLFGQPPRVLPLKEVRALKRGFPISEGELKVRNDAFPAKTWDVRPKD